MILINHAWVIDGLRELSSEAEQRRLWLSAGGEVSSFVECYYQTFEDTCLNEAIESGETEFGVEVDALFKDLEQSFGPMVDEWQSEEEAIADPRMAGIRDLASETLRRILAAGSKNVAGITARLVEWQSEEQQRKLWLPAMEGETPKSRPYDAAWHLLRGKDYWGYLDLGKRRREFSGMSDDLEEHVFGRMKVAFRSPKEIISDPGMRPVRQLAARIIGKLDRNKVISRSREAHIPLENFRFIPPELLSK